MIEFDHLEYDQECDRLFVCGVNWQGESHKTPILRLSSVCMNENTITIFDSEEPKFIYKADSIDEARKKLEEIRMIIASHKHCLSNFKP